MSRIFMKSSSWSGLLFHTDTKHFTIRDQSPERKGSGDKDDVEYWLTGYDVPEDDDELPLKRKDFGRLIFAVHQTEVGEDGWEKLTSFENCEVWRQADPHSGVTLIKAYAYFPKVSIDVVFRLIMDPKVRMAWDPVFSDMYTPKVYDGVQDVLYFAIKAPASITNRDFLQYRTYKKNARPGCHLIVYRQAPDTFVEVKDTHVRALTYTAGYVLTEDPDDPESSSLRIVSQNDIRGFIPKPIVNFFAQRMPNEWYDKLYEAGKMYQEEQEETKEI